MKPFLKLTYLELKLQLREPVALFFTLAFPVMLMLLFGVIFGNEAEKFLGGYGQVDLSSTLSIWLTKKSGKVS